MFGPASRSFLYAVIAATVVVTVLLLWGWNRLRGPAVVRVAQRLLLVLLAQALAVASVFGVVNRANLFFTSWSELTGTQQAPQVTIDGQASQPAATPPHPTPTAAATTATAARHVDPAPFVRGSDGVWEATLTGPASGMRGTIDVWIPDGTQTGSPLQVVLSLPGIPGPPSHALTMTGVIPAVQGLVARHQLPATAVVAATISPTGHYTDCADIPGGPRVTTWLTQDVPALVARSFDVDTTTAWPVTGVSSGGSCAVRLALGFPARFGPAISMSGDLVAESPTSGVADLRTLVAAGATRPKAVLMAASRQDPGTVADAQRLHAAATGHVEVDVEELSTGAHNWSTWAAMMPAAMAWAAAHLGQ